MPGLQSAASAVAGFIVVLSLSLFFEWPHAWALAGLAAGLTFGGSWAMSLYWWRSRLTGQARTKVEQEPLKVMITASDPSGAYQAGVFLSLPGVDQKTMRQVARLVLDGRSFSMGSMSGRNRPLSRSTYTALRDEFISRGLASWVSDKAHSQGVVLTPGGKAFMRWLQNSPLEEPGSLQNEFLRHATGARAAHARLTWEDE